MGDWTDPRVTDEATGLPPLEDVDPGDTILVLGWTGGIGVAVAPGSEEAIPVRFLSVRGLIREERNNPHNVRWAQMHLAVPVEHAVDVSVALASGGAVDDAEGGDVERS